MSTKSPNVPQDPADCYVAPTIKMRDVPEDIFCIIVQEQARLKMKRHSGQCSFAQAVYSILRAHKKCEKEIKK